MIKKNERVLQSGFDVSWQANLRRADWPEGTIPIVYMPGVSRQMLRAVETCPRELQPLAELQYRGVLWSQVSARDWTILAFLKSKDGLGLDVAQDHATLGSTFARLVNAC